MKGAEGEEAKSLAGAGRAGHIRTMALLKIARMGHPVLRRIAEPVPDPTDPDLRRLIADMEETMADAAGVGLAAPQVHVSRRIIVFKVPGDRASEAPDDEPLELTALINPEIEPIGEGKALGWEGCLSIPGLRGIVPRHRRIRYRGLLVDGRVIEREVAGFHARVIQHEVDHLDGILYIDRMPDLSLLTFTEEMRHFAESGQSPAP